MSSLRIDNSRRGTFCCARNISSAVMFLLQSHTRSMHNRNADLQINGLMPRLSRSKSDFLLTRISRLVFLKVLDIFNTVTYRPDF